MNEQYDTEKFRTQIMDRFSPMMKVPSLSTKESLQKIIEKRTQAACVDISFENVWEDFTIDLLFDYYSKNSLRTLMSLCNLSVQNAKSDGSNTISIAHIENARLDITS